MVSNEKFWSGVAQWFNKLKLKATYGLVGNDQIGADSDRFFYISDVNMQAGDKGVSFGDKHNKGVNGIAISHYPDDKITWEKSYKTNLGIELGLFNGLEILTDVFFENRKNILMARYYNLNGMMVNADQLTPGIYIRVQGTKVSKVALK